MVNLLEILCDASFASVILPRSFDSTTKMIISTSEVSIKYTFFKAG